MWEGLITAIVVGLLTLFDLDETFYIPYIPENSKQKKKLYCWWWGFILANSIVATLVYLAITEDDYLKGIRPWLRAVVVGLGYLTFMRAKLTTFKMEGQEIPFGPELFYERAKGFVYRKINDIVTEASIIEIQEYADNHTLEELVRHAKQKIDSDRLIKNKTELKNLVEATATDRNSSEQKKRDALAFFIKTGKKI